MIIETILVFYGIAILLALSSLMFKDFKHFGMFASGFVLIILSVFMFTDGIEFRSGESHIKHNDNYSTVEYVYTENYNSKLPLGGVTLAAALGLFFGGNLLYQKKKEDNY